MDRHMLSRYYYEGTTIRPKPEQNKSEVLYKQADQAPPANLNHIYKNSLETQLEKTTAELIGWLSNWGPVVHQHQQQLRQHQQKERQQLLLQRQEQLSQQQQQTLTDTTTAHHTGLSFWGLKFLSLRRSYRITFVLTALARHRVARMVAF
jgi:putative cell wall-binding protein